MAAGRVCAKVFWVVMICDIREWDGDVMKLSLRCLISRNIIVLFAEGVIFPEKVKRKTQIKHNV